MALQHTCGNVAIIVVKFGGTQTNFLYRLSVVNKHVPIPPSYHADSIPSKVIWIIPCTIDCTQINL